MSGGMLLAVGAGLVLYQMTSLVLAPAASSRQLPLAVSAPAVDLVDVSSAVIIAGGVVVGVLAPASASTAPVVVAYHANPKPSSTAKPVTLAPTASPTPQPATEAPSKHAKPLPTGHVKRDIH